MRRTAGALLIAVLVAGVTPATAQTPSGASSQPGRSLAVSVPADPPSIRPGETSVVKIRVVNSGTKPVDVRITGSSVVLGDQGRVAVEDRPDPVWGSRVTFPRGPLSLKAMSYRDVSLVVHMPAHIDPDLYFVGFLVTPVANAAGQVTVVNQIGSFFVINVPGARVRSLHGALAINPTILWGLRIPWFVIGTRATGSLAIANVGRSAVQFWGEVDNSDWPAAGTQTSRLDRSLLPIGRRRVYAVRTEHVWLIGMATVKAIVIYPKNDEQTTTQIVLIRRVLIISPWLIAAVALLVVVAAWLLLRRRRRRKRARLSRGGGPKPRTERPLVTTGR